MILSASTLRLWQECSLKAKFTKIDNLPTIMNAKASFGTCIHHALELYNQTGNIDLAIAIFRDTWHNPEKLGVTPVKWPKFTSFEGLLQRGVECLQNYHDNLRWDGREVVFTEHPFLVPFGRHWLRGVVDLGEVRVSGKGKPLFRIVDYKTNSQAPTRAALNLDIQFCADLETEILTTRGWCRATDLVAGESVMTLNPLSSQAEWQPLTDIHIFPEGQRDLVSFESRRHSSLTTVDHRWYVEHMITTKGATRRESRIRTSSELTNSDRVLCSAPVANLPTEEKWSSDFVELVAWFWTEGHWLGGFDSGYGIGIGQSEAVNPQHTSRIRQCLTRLYGEPSISLRRGHATVWPAQWREKIDPDCNRFYLNKTIGDELRLVADRDKAVSAAFLTALTQQQLELYIQVSMWGDRSSSYQINQSNKRRLDSFQMACSLAGIHSTLRRDDVSSGRYAGRECWSLTLRTDRYVVPTSSGSKVLLSHSGPVWCPSTPNQTWLARRNGSVYFTGNTIYTFASVQPEFWMGVDGDPDYPGLSNGEFLYGLYKDMPRRAIWWHLWTGKEIDAGPRDEDDYMRLYRLCNEVEKAVERDVFVPRIGEACGLCSFVDQCRISIPSRDQELEDEEAWI